MENLLKAAQIVNAFGTLAIGIVLAWIAYQQYRTNWRNLQVSTYDRKLRVYNAVREICTQVVRDGRPTLELRYKLSEPLSESHFLFEDEIPRYLEELWKKIVDGVVLHDQLYDRAGQPVYPPGVDRVRVSRERGDNTLWFNDQLERVKELFRPHLRLT
jgi:hypothetical protein